VGSDRHISAPARRLALFRAELLNRGSSRVNDLAPDVIRLATAISQRGVATQRSTRTGSAYASGWRQIVTVTGGTRRALPSAICISRILDGFRATWRTDVLGSEGCRPPDSSEPALKRGPDRPRRYALYREHFGFAAGSRCSPCTTSVPSPARGRERSTSRTRKQTSGRYLMGGGLFKRRAQRQQDTCVRLRIENLTSRSGPTVASL